MKFSENWLRTYVNPALDSAELAHVLTMAGLEVEAITPAAPMFDKVVVGIVVAMKKHPNADKLNVCEVRVGDADEVLLHIVCGAANVRVGAKVPCAQVGATLPGITIKQAKVRGEESMGMLCSASELGLAESADGLLLLPPDAPVGADFRNYYELDDSVFTLKLTPNRADCLSVMGVAREVAAITDSPWQASKTTVCAVEIDDTLKVSVADDASLACPLYCGRVMRGVNLDAATPLWMMRRLDKSGLRSINAVVDVTNYVMLETGQPLHAFDLAKIDGEIQIRFARAGETLLLLNEAIASLQTDMLVIADAAQPLALAGVMGGKASGVTATTTDLFLESAFFSPQAIAGKALQLNANSDSAHRFERGVDFAATRDALERATQLILEICGGKSGAVTEIKAAVPPRAPIAWRVARVQRVLGIVLSDAQIANLLQRLQLQYTQQDGIFSVSPPSYRFDLAIEEDLIEEIARIHGYDAIPATPPHGDLRLLPQAENLRPLARLKNTLVARDYQEVINYAFVDAGWEADFCDNQAPVALKNPIASQMSVMRSSLLGGLIANLQFNLNRKQSRLRLFEVGGCFEKSANGFVQTEKCAALCFGDAPPEQWGSASRGVDFYDVKADIEALYAPLHLQFVVAPHPALHPGRSASVRVAGKAVGWVGELHPRWLHKYALARPPVVFELSLESLSQTALPVFAATSKFPPVRRDIAVLADDALPVQSLLDTMRSANLPIVLELALFDVYRGQGVDIGKKSLAFRVLLQDTEKTLTDGEADLAVLQLVKLLQNKHNVHLRT